MITASGAAPQEETPSGEYERLYYQTLRRLVKEEPYLLDPKGMLFGLGYSSTGRWALGNMLTQLGYRCFHTQDNKSLLLETDREQVLPRISEIVNRFDAVLDLSCFFYFRELDEKYPDARFVLARIPDEEYAQLFERNKEQWSTNLKANFKPLFHPGFELYFEGHVAFYSRQCHQIEHYFQNRPGKLLVLDWKQAANWLTLYRFLAQAGSPSPADLPPLASTQLSFWL